MLAIRQSMRTRSSVVLKKTTRYQKEEKNFPEQKRGCRITYIRQQVKTDVTLIMKDPTTNIHPSTSSTKKRHQPLPSSIYQKHAAHSQ